MDEYRYVIDNYRSNDIPLDAQWGDIDYMDRYRSFTYDPMNFNNMTRYVDDLYHNMNIKFIPIVHPSIAVRPGYQSFDTGLEQNVFLKSPADDGTPFIG